MAKKKNMFLVSLTPYLDKAIKDIAEKTGESQASVVREAIRDKLEKIGYVVKKNP